MLADTDRLQHTVEQVLQGRRASAASRKSRSRAPVDLAADRARMRGRSRGRAITCSATRSRSIARRRGRCRAAATPRNCARSSPNLLDNAVKYSGDDVRVTVDVAAPAPDTRLGPRAGSRHRHSRRRSSSASSIASIACQPRGSKVKGTGLGLYIVRSIARAHGGRVFAESEGEGRARPSPRTAAGSPADMSRILSSRTSSTSPTDCASTSKPKATRSIVAGDGEDALDRLLRRAAAFDAVVLDVMLPGKDGFAVATELRGAGQFVPVLMLTARGRAEDVLQRFESGADDYLPKPFELAILLARLRGCCGAAGGTAARMRRRRADGSATPLRGRSYTFAGRTLDFAAMEVRARGESHRLTLMECELLRYLVKNAGQPVSRRRSSRTCGACTRGPTRARSTTSSSGCVGTLKTSPRRRGSC